MDIVLYSLLLLGGLAFIIYPLFAGRQRWLSQESPKAERRMDLLKEKESIYAAIKDLDFEYKTGKLSDEDYVVLRENYRASALNILKQINEPEEGAVSSDAVPAVENGSIEQEDTTALTETAVGAELDEHRCIQCGQANPPGSKFCRACGVPLETVPTCSMCGAARKPGDRFCRACGKPFDS